MGRHSWAFAPRRASSFLPCSGSRPSRQAPPLAQGWPSKTIRAVVPLTAGSATDQIGRAVLDPVAAALGQPIIIENRPGAGNTLGMAQVARADADGYTLLVNSSSHSIVPATYANLPFDTLRDLTAVVPLGNMPTVLVVSPVEGLQDARRPCCRRQGEARRHELLVGRRRQFLAFCNRGVPARGRLPGRACAQQGRAGGDHRGPGRARPTSSSRRSCSRCRKSAPASCRLWR